MIRTSCSKPFFSVVIPLYNKARSVARAVRSVLAQDFGDFELLVVNDGSTDAGPGVVASMNDSRLRCIDQPNSGVSAARNRGVDESRSRCVAFLDADDQWQSSFLITIRRLVERYPQAGLYGSAYAIVDRNGKRVVHSPAESPDDGQEGVLENYFRCAWSRSPPVCASSVCVRKEAFRSAGGFPAGVRSGEDTALWARIALAHDVVVSRRCEATYFQGGTENNAQFRYFGLDGHFDFLSLLEGRSEWHQYEDLERWVEKKMYEIAMAALVHGNDPAAVQSILRRVPSRHWRSRRRMVRGLLAIPVGARRALFRVRQFWKALRPSVSRMHAAVVPRSASPFVVPPSGGWST